MAVEMNRPLLILLTAAVALAQNSSGTLQTKITLVLGANDVAETGSYAVGIVDRLGPDKTRQEWTVPGLRSLFGKIFATGEPRRFQFALTFDF